MVSLILKTYSPLSKDASPDIAFKYDRNGRTDSIIYNKVDVIQSINYSNRGWVDSLVVNRNSDEILKIAFDRDINGMIDTQKVSYWTKDPLKVNYSYDNYYRLESFESLINGTSNKTESYEYDKMGNRKKKTNSVVTSYTYDTGANSNKLLSFAESGSTDVTQYEYNEIGGVDKVKNYNTGTFVTDTKEEFDYLSNGLVKRYVEHVDAATYPPLSPCVTSETYTSGSNTWVYRYNENNQLESKRLYQSDTSDNCKTFSWVYNKIGAYGDVKTVYHGKQYKIGSRKIIFYPDKYLSANGLVEIYPDGTKEYNILDNMNSTRLKIKENDTTLTFADYEPYGENQLHSTDDIPKRGYMGSNKSKENGYMQMGARLYNAETGRFMSVDPLMEIFTGHSPYHYSYNNPVMFSDPSGLAPEGEKNSKVQAPGDDIIGSSHTNGYWAESTHKVWNGRMSLVNPLDPSTHKIYEEDFVWEWVPGSSGGGAGGSGSGGVVAPSGSGMKSGGRTSSKVHTTSLNKSMRDQIYNEGSFGNQSGSMVSISTSVCVGCENNNNNSKLQFIKYLSSLLSTYPGDPIYNEYGELIGIVGLQFDTKGNGYFLNFMMMDFLPENPTGKYRSFKTTKDKIAHIFSGKPGHFPKHSSLLSGTMFRILKIFDEIAQNSKNLVKNPIGRFITQEAFDNGIQVYVKNFPVGQIWLEIDAKGFIRSGGINQIPR